MQSQILNMDRYVKYLGLFSIMLLSTVMAGCPTRCICSKNAVRCVGKSLMDVPSFETLENNPMIIDLSSNNIDYIAHYALSFDKAEIVEILYLNDSKIIDIDDTAFKELINMKELYLSGNVLSDLPPNSFKYNDNLVYLDLSYNLFRYMPKIKATRLETLNLMNSGIEIIENDRFTDLPSLVYLNLQKNNIRYLETEMFKYLPNLAVIELDFNAWECNCHSVNLFNTLKAKGVLKISELIQCKTKNDLFISIFDNSGAVEPVKKLCTENEHNVSYNFGGEFSDMDVVEQKLNQKRRNKKFDGPNEHMKPSIKRNRQKGSALENLAKLNNASCEHIVYSATFTLSTYVIFCSCLLVAFLVGLTLGTLILNPQKNSGTTDGSSCCDSLVKSV